MAFTPPSSIPGGATIDGSVAVTVASLPLPAGAATESSLSEISALAQSDSTALGLLTASALDTDLDGWVEEA